MIKILLSLLPFLVSSSYNQGLSLELGYMSAIAYESSSSIKNWSCGKCNKYKLTNIQFFQCSDKSLQGFAGYSAKDNAILLSFRGSSNIRNWINNINGDQVSYSGCSGCYVHRGFYDSFKRIYGDAKQALKKVRSAHQGAKIIITGHSLGGALAALSSVQIKKDVGSVADVYTFGEPRLGNKNLADYLSKQCPILRVINYADIVPHLPTMTFNFYHESKQIWYHPRGMNKYSECLSEDQKCANSISPNQFSVDDHDIEKYLQMKGSSWRVKGSSLQVLNPLKHRVKSF